MFSNEDNVDLHRDTQLRYFGYANEVGEAFRHIAPWFVRPSYVIAFGYVLTDATDKSWKQYNKEGRFSSSVAIKGGDVLIWQTLASVLIPGFAINRVVAVSGHLYKARKMKSLQTWGPTLTGLAAIPFIIRPIDRGVDILLDNTYRKALNLPEKE